MLYRWRGMICLAVFRPCERNGYDMRYVIGICILTGLIIWDGFRNDGRYLDMALRSVSSLIRSVIG
jgi:hypothetical protein